MGVCCSSRGRPPAKPTIVTVSSKSRNAIQKLEEKQAQMERFVQSTIQKGKPWTDPEFPPEQSSLYDPRLDDVDQQTYQSFSWKRASEIY